MKAIVKRAFGYILWVVLVMALLASVKHVAWAFGSVEFAGEQSFGWVPAIAVDLGLAAIVYGIQQRRKAKRKIRGLLLGVMIFSTISIVANLMHAAAAIGVELPVWARAATTIILSATLPVLVIYIGEIVSSNDAQSAKKSEQTDERVVTLSEQMKKEKESSKLAIQELNDKLNDATVELNAVKASRSIEAMTDNKNGWHEQWVEYLTEHPNTSQRELAQVFSVSVGTVNSRLKALKSQVN